ncbi:MAG: FAD-dependent oxidoreductase [Chloroflexi bacterium]|nr:FAD-dependent oxidoreductase [Chloroflexota bacterium]
MRHFLGKAHSNGTRIAYKTKVIGIERVSKGYELRTESRVVINCAGLYSDRVAEMAGIDIGKANYSIHWCKGEYYSMSGGKNNLVNRLIYPVPLSISVGAHVCLDVSGRLRLGPLFYYVDDVDYKIDDSRKKAVLESSIMKALPFLEPSDLDPETSGIMAMLQGQGEGFRDFVIRHEYDRGLPGFINLVGIESRKQRLVRW